MVRGRLELGTAHRNPVHGTEVPPSGTRWKVWRPDQPRPGPFGGFGHGVWPATSDVGRVVVHIRHKARSAPPIFSYADPGYGGIGLRARPQPLRRRSCPQCRRSAARRATHQGGIGDMRPPRILPQSLLSAAAAQEGLVSKAQCDAAGIGKDAVALLIRQGRWRRVTRRVYDTDPELAERRRRGDYHCHVRRRATWTGMLAVPDGIATGVCALALLGVDGLPSDLVPEAARPGGMYAAVGGGVVLRRYKSVADQPYRGRRIASVVPALAQALGARAASSWPGSTSSGPCRTAGTWWSRSTDGHSIPATRCSRRCDAAERAGRHLQAGRLQVPGDEVLGRRPDRTISPPPGCGGFATGRSAP
jgi:hypothetical protein